MQPSPLLSIITPVRNGADFIASCIGNVAAQSHGNVEHLIIDGGSTDATTAIVAELAQKYRHVRWISEPDRGQSDAMNKGIAMASGEVIGFLNADDYYEPNVLERVAEIFRTLPKPGLAVGNCKVWNDEGELLYVAKPSKLKLRQLLVGPVINLYPVNPSQYFYHRSLHDLIGPYDIDDHYAMDLDFLLRAVQVAYVRYCDEHWGNFRLIAGTKTFEDQQSCGNVKRYSKVLAYYKKDLPWLLRRLFPLYQGAQAAELVARYLLRRLSGRTRPAE